MKGYYILRDDGTFYSKTESIHPRVIGTFVCPPYMSMATSFNSFQDASKECDMLEQYWTCNRFHIVNFS